MQAHWNKQDGCLDQNVDLYIIILHTCEYVSHNLYPFSVHIVTFDFYYQPYALI